MGRANSSGHISPALQTVCQARVYTFRGQSQAFVRRCRRWLPVADLSRESCYSAILKPAPCSNSRPELEVSSGLVC